MAQYLKEHVRAAILDAAAIELAEVGYERAGLATIAGRAKTSIGNVYKYFADKEALFSAVIPPSLVKELKALFCGRVKSLHAEREVTHLGPKHPYRQAAEELFEFSLAHRHQLIFLLRHAEQTPYACFRQALEQHLVTLAVAYARQAYPEFRLTSARRRTLGRIYRSFLDALTNILVENMAPGDTRQATDQLVLYHLHGLRGFFMFGVDRE